MMSPQSHVTVTQKNTGEGKSKPRGNSTQQGEPSLRSQDYHLQFSAAEQNTEKWGQFQTKREIEGTNCSNNPKLIERNVGKQDPPQNQQHEIKD